jgi:hypothetical protein
MPIDVYFYEVRGPDGRQYVQDGNPLWGRFVRIPAAGHDAGSTAKWWHMEWVFRDGRWEQSHLENVPVEGLSPATTRPAPRPKIPDDLGDLD